MLFNQKKTASTHKWRTVLFQCTGAQKTLIALLFFFFFSISVFLCYLFFILPIFFHCFMLMFHFRLAACLLKYTAFHSLWWWSPYCSVLPLPSLAHCPSNLIGGTMLSPSSVFTFLKLIWTLWALFLRLIGKSPFLNLIWQTCYANMPWWVVCR